MFQSFNEPPFQLVSESWDAGLKERQHKRSDGKCCDLLKLAQKLCHRHIPRLQPSRLDRDRSMIHIQYYIQYSVAV